MESVTYTELKEAEKRCQIACRQMLLLNDQLEGLKIRYHNAVAANFRCFRYPLRMKIVTIEGVINMYYQYTVEKTERSRNSEVQNVWRGTS